MSDNSCTIEFNRNGIGYNDCRHWEFVGIVKSNSPSYDVDLFSIDGADYKAKVTFFNDRVSFQLKHDCPMVSRDYYCSFALEKLIPNLPPLPGN
jgi:hypothetical protein